MGKWIRIMDTPEADLEERQKSYLSNLLNEEWCKRTGEGLITLESSVNLLQVRDLGEPGV